MKKVEINKEKVREALLKMIDNKESVKAFLRGEITKQDLDKKGIKLVNPL